MTSTLTAAFDRILDNLDRRYTNATHLLIDDVVKGTPRDTGKTQNSWRAGINSNAPKDKGAPTEKSSQVIADGLINSVGALKITDTIEIVNNNQPAANILEFGGSDQAPDGWIRAAASNWSQYFRAGNPGSNTTLRSFNNTGAVE